MLMTRTRPARLHDLHRRPPATWGRVAGALAALAVTLGPMGVGAVRARTASPPSPKDATRVAQEVLTSGDYQTSIDAPAEAPDPLSPRALPDLGGGYRRAASVGTVVLWLLVGLVAALVMVWAVAAWRERRWGRGGEDGPDDAREAPPSPAARAAMALPVPLAHWDELARQGRYGEAAHALLLDTLATLAARRQTPLPPSRTARELTRELANPAEHGPLLTLVSVVERAVFAQAPVGPDDWARCLDARRALAL